MGSAAVWLFCRYTAVPQGISARFMDVIASLNNGDVHFGFGVLLGTTLLCEDVLRSNLPGGCRLLVMIQLGIVGYLVYCRLGRLGVVLRCRRGVALLDSLRNRFGRVRGVAGVLCLRTAARLLAGRRNERVIVQVRLVESPLAFSRRC